MARNRKYPELQLGLLPATAINAALGTELVTAPVRLSSRAHRHMAEDHPQDYAACVAALSIAVAHPSFVGQAPGQTRNFEVVRRIARLDGQAVLAAVTLEIDNRGTYRVVSCYLIGRAVVDDRRRIGRLVAVLAP